MTIGRRHPVQQVGQVATGQDRRDVTVGEVTRARARPGFTCRDGPEAARVSVHLPFRTPSALLDGTCPVDG